MQQDLRDLVDLPPIKDLRVIPHRVLRDLREVHLKDLKVMLDLHHKVIRV